MATAGDLIGTKLGDYEVQALIGSGGMATVYRAFDPKLQRSVAIKVLSERTAAEPGFIERFRGEALLLANLQHPNIVHVYDFGEQDGHLFMVQELLPGPTLEQRLRELAAEGKQMERDEILSTLKQLASALDAAHQAGIIHRDVKPCNALWNRTGALVLTDFGIAKNIQGDANLTQVGMVMGTPAYIAPEQAQGQALTPATDIYALGVVLYELVTGQPPFSGDTPMGVVLQHIQAPPPPVHPLRADVPESVEPIVARALAKQPEARFGTAGELAQALEQAWPADAAAGAPATVDNKATRMWSPAAVVAPAAVPAESPAQASPGPDAAPTRVQRAVPPVAETPGEDQPTDQSPFGGKKRLLAVGALLALLLACGLMRMVRSGSGASGELEPLPTFTVSALAAAAPTIGGQGIVTPKALPSATPPATAEPATSPAASPTSPPAASPASPPPASPTSPPAPDIAPTGDPAADLRALLEAGIANGQAGEEGKKLLEKLDGAFEAMSEGDSKKVMEKLGELRRDLEKKAAEGKIDSDFAQQAIEGVESLAAQYVLSIGDGGFEELDEEDEEDKEEKGNGRGRGRGRGKGKGKKKDD